MVLTHSLSYHTLWHTLTHFIPDFITLVHLYYTLYYTNSSMNPWWFFRRLICCTIVLENSELKHWCLVNTPVIHCWYTLSYWWHTLSYCRHTLSYCWHTLSCEIDRLSHTLEHIPYIFSFTPFHHLLHPLTHPHTLLYMLLCTSFSPSLCSSFYLQHFLITKPTNELKNFWLIWHCQWIYLKWFFEEEVEHILSILVLSHL